MFRSLAVRQLSRPIARAAAESVAISTSQTAGSTVNLAAGLDKNDPEYQRLFLERFRQKLDSDVSGRNDFENFLDLPEGLPPTAASLGPLKRGSEPLPPWLKLKIPKGATNQPRFNRIRRSMREKKLSTVCEEAKCPNIGECWGGEEEDGTATATIMVMGSHCTRGCRFCSVLTSRKPPPLDPEEPQKVAEAVKEMGVEYIVMTMVDRDDIADCGASHVCRCVEEVKRQAPQVLLEALVGDFQGKLELVEQVAQSPLSVFAHNIECVERVTPRVRDRRATYQQSLRLLEHVSSFTNGKLLTKSSIMLGLGEEEAEIRQTLRDLRTAGVSAVTLGQYLQPSRTRLKVSRYAHPKEFEMWEKEALDMGFLYCASGPLVRSSYRAGEFYMKNILQKRAAGDAKRDSSPSCFCPYLLSLSYIVVDFSSIALLVISEILLTRSALVRPRGEHLLACCSLLEFIIIYFIFVGSDICVDYLFFIYFIFSIFSVEQDLHSVWFVYTSLYLRYIYIYIFERCISIIVSVTPLSPKSFHTVEHTCSPETLFHSFRLSTPFLFFSPYALSVTTALLPDIDTKGGVKHTLTSSPSMRLCATEVSGACDTKARVGVGLPTFANSADLNSYRKLSDGHDGERVRSGNIAETTLLPCIEHHCTPLTIKGNQAPVIGRPVIAGTDHKHTPPSINDEESEQKTISDLQRSLSFRSNAFSSQSDGAAPSKRSSVRAARPSLRFKKPVSQNEMVPPELGSGMLPDSHLGSHARGENKNDTLRSAKEVLRRHAVPLSGPVRTSSFYKTNTASQVRSLRSQNTLENLSSTHHPNNSMMGHSAQLDDPQEHRVAPIPSPRPALKVESSNSVMPDTVHLKAEAPLDLQRGGKPNTQPGLLEMFDTSLLGQCAETAHSDSDADTDTESGCDSDSDSDADSDDMVHRHQERVSHRLRCLTQPNSEEARTTRHESEPPVSPTDVSGSTSRSFNLLGGTGLSCHSESHLPVGRRKQARQAFLHPTFADEIEDANTSSGVGQFGFEGIFKPVTATSSKERSLWHGLGLEDCSSEAWYARVQKKLREEEGGESMEKSQSRSAAEENYNASPEEPSTTRLVNVPETELCSLEPQPPAEAKTSTHTRTRHFSSSRGTAVMTKREEIKSFHPYVHDTSLSLFIESFCYFIYYFSCVFVRLMRGTRGRFFISQKVDSKERKFDQSRGHLKKSPRPDRKEETPVLYIYTLKHIQVTNERGYSGTLDAYDEQQLLEEFSGRMIHPFSACDHQIFFLCVITNPLPAVLLHCRPLTFTDQVKQLDTSCGRNQCQRDYSRREPTKKKRDEVCLYIQRLQYCELISCVLASSI
eukprot:gene4144-2986_t